ncbi:unnamed protein product [Acanthoscelides obtectus]|uniref:Uncharacterized protein n=1 Tax=Acanthoscelides obtectus TaxID=200917 RepID=A0A9P0Q4K8_ACAOB|nr:unnamed protein product [Acanthoscelides obtectus]CAK1643509.1 hypothetical protein AOBTE_LOCUS13556 [Acanthoscelides obtectus]
MNIFRFSFSLGFLLSVQFSSSVSIKLIFFFHFIIRISILWDRLVLPSSCCIHFSIQKFT